MHDVNIELMSFTLDVSKLNVWLNANAWANMKRMSITLDVSKLNA